VLEIGPGWYLIGCVIFYLKGASQIVAFDHLPHASYKLIVRLLRTIRDNADICAEHLGVDSALLRKRCEIPLNAQSLEQLLEQLSIDYRAPGDAGATGLAAESIDVVFSYGVLEHVPKDDLRRVFQESARVLKRDGMSYHNIGLHDHFHTAGLGNGVNFLRYSESYWNFLTGHALGYHNRLRLPDYLNLFKETGLVVRQLDTELTPNNLLALGRIRINERFRGMTTEELATSHLYVDLAPAERNPNVPDQASSRICATELTYT
jgi:SAM-dependent methyltransferase